MPDRIMLDAGLLTSDAYNALDADARDLYVRLLLVVDDFGCFDGREAVVASNAYPLGRTEPLPLDQLHAQALVVFYLNAGRRYLAITRWREGLRLKRKFPAPPLNVDLPEIKLRAKYGAKPGVVWKNPSTPPSDDVSLLCDRSWRVVTPQPQEWRNTTDWAPISTTPAVTAGAPEAPDDSTPSQHAVTAGSDTPLRIRSALTTARTDLPGTLTETVKPVVTARSDSTPSNVSGGNGEEKKIEFKNGAWIGLSDEQQRAWQSVFDGVAIGDQLDRMAAWLEANSGERDAIARAGEFQAFIVRWLLRESRTH